MKARLFCRTGQLAGAGFDITNEATIGKSPGNTIQLYPALISGKHARIYYDEKAKAYFLEDLNSRNGTKLDGAPVRGTERLGKLHVITFANTFDFIFQVSEAIESKPASAPPAQAPAPAKKEERKPQPVEPAPQPPRVAVAPPVADRLKTVYDDEAMAAPPVFEQRLEKAAEASPAADDAARTKVGVDFTPVPSFAQPSKPPKQADAEGTGGALVLVFESLKGTSQAFDLKEGSSIVGRDASCAIVVDDPSVSRRHAEFVLKNNRLTVKDLGSKNHTYVDNQRISTEVEVHAGKQITFGLVRARLVRKPTR